MKELRRNMRFVGWLVVLLFVGLSGWFAMTAFSQGSIWASNVYNTRLSSVNALRGDITDRDGTVLVDSITACLSERMFPDGTPNARAGREITGELLTVSRSCRHLIAVCDDLWHGGEDYRDWTEVYVRELAEICRALASEFDAVCEMTAGLPRLWKGELPRV